jgi:hypothetical protein
MKPLSIRKDVFLLPAAAQLLLVFTYFTLNIQRAGGIGVALPLLVGFFVFSGISFIAQLLKSTLTLNLNLFLFLMLVFWVGLRVIVDLGDLEYLKQLTIATTGGMLLFIFNRNLCKAST